MKRTLNLQRYLAHFDSSELPELFTEVLVIGSGIAGLSAALEAAKSCSVLVLTKAGEKDTCTYQAQGGIAAAISPDDSPGQHFDDTVCVGSGLCKTEAVEVLTREAGRRVMELMELGTKFDTAANKLSFTREGGHSRPRILHANGDATGSAIQETLVERAKENENISLYKDSFVIDLLAKDGICHGALTWNKKEGAALVFAKKCILATGGCGRIFRETTNPSVATGDGLAMALRAGAELQDMEFFQFHPTALYVAGAARALISESLRGEGAILINRNGERFMAKYHPDGELAPRDMVSRGILQEMKNSGDTHVLLDITKRSRSYLEKRFPTITRLCDEFEIDVSVEPIPVHPAAHYQVGGIKCDLNGHSSVANLLVCGEVASTGVHGANRLGSNSLLESIVFGRKAGAEAASGCRGTGKPKTRHFKQKRLQPPATAYLNLTDVENSLRSLMWRNVGIERDRPGLDNALGMIAFWCRYVTGKEFDSPRGWELQNMLAVGRVTGMAALKREESRGVHFRTDFPETSSSWKRHIIISKQDFK